MKYILTEKEYKELQEKALMYDAQINTSQELIKELMESMSKAKRILITAYWTDGHYKKIRIYKEVKAELSKFV